MTNENKPVNDLQRIQLELKAPKSKRNTFGNYNYRNCEDILEAAKPLLAQYNCGLVVSDEVIQICNIPVITAKAIFTDSNGVTTTVTAHAGVELQKKGMDVAQTFGASSSYARKYALNGLFLIDDTKDYDSDEYHQQSQKSQEQHHQQQQREQQQAAQKQAAEQKKILDKEAADALKAIEQSNSPDAVKQIIAQFSKTVHAEKIRRCGIAKADKEGWSKPPKDAQQ